MVPHRSPNQGTVAEDQAMNDRNVGAIAMETARELRILGTANASSMKT